MKNPAERNSLELINTCIKEKKFDELGILLEDEKVSLEKTEQDWENSPLVNLIKSGIDSDEKVELFKKLVEREASLNVKSTPLNWNLLHYLIMTSEMRAEIRKVNSFEKKVIEVIAEKQPSLINERDKTGYTPIAYAVENREADIVILFVSKGADLNAPIYSGTNQVETLVDIALKNFDQDVLPVSLNQEQEKVYKATDAVFKRIISENNSQKYKEVLIHLHEENKLGFYKALHQNKMAILNLAIEKNDFAFLEDALVGSDIGPLGYFTKDQFDKLFLYRKYCSNSVVNSISNFLAKYINDPTWPHSFNQNKKTLLHQALINNDKDTVKSLIENGADINVKGNLGSNLFHLLTYQWDQEFAQFLIDNGANIKARDNLGHTPLHMAVYHGDVKAKEYLIKHSVDINANTNIDNILPLLNTIKSHISYFGVEESFFSKLFRIFEKACAILPAIHGEDISANVTFQNEVDSILDKIRLDFKISSGTNIGIAR